MKEWIDAAAEKLKGSLDCIDWDVFVDSSSDINELTELYWFLCRVYNSTENCKNVPQ